MSREHKSNHKKSLSYFEGSDCRLGYIGDGIRGIFHLGCHVSAQKVPDFRVFVLGVDKLGTLQLSRFL